VLDPNQWACKLGSEAVPLGIIEDLIRSSQAGTKAGCILQTNYHEIAYGTQPEYPRHLRGYLASPGVASMSALGQFSMGKPLLPPPAIFLHFVDADPECTRLSSVVANLSSPKGGSRLRTAQERVSYLSLSVQFCDSLQRSRLFKDNFSLAERCTSV
jgi:hypothetical protein